MQWNDFQSNFRHLSLGDQERVKEAFELGKSSHAGQKRASGEEYFTHCLTVATLLAHYNADADTICAALLHDSVEDTGTTLRDIEERFGSSTARLIDGVTKLTQRELGPSPTLDEKIETLRKMFTLLQEDVRIMIIKLCDRLHNMQTIVFLPENKRENLAQETWDIYVNIADRLCMQDLRDELGNLCLAVLRSAEYPTLAERRIHLLKAAEHAASSMRETWERQGISLPSSLTISPEVVRLSHLSHAKNIPLPIAFVTTNVEDCYRMLFCIHSAFQRVLGSFEDFINSPQINGYRAVHTTIALADGTRIRCKLRTEEMHAYARQGVTVWCFDENERRQRTGKLAWAIPLPTLTAETADRSEEFFEGLRSDILGETITILGPEDRPFTVPAGSTVLDGAFYCFGEMALRITSLTMNGQEVPLKTPLEPGASLEATFGKHESASREWLAFVTTRHAASFIHRKLASIPAEAKRKLGKELLQEAFTRERRGLIEEFDVKALEQRLHHIGLPSLDDAYIAIAEGRREPEEISAALFTTAAAKTMQRKRGLLTFTTDLKDTAVVRTLVDLYERYHLSFSDIRFWRVPGSDVRRWRVKVQLTSEEQQTLAKEVRLAGGRDVTHLSSYARIRLPLIVISLSILWGFDPLMAKMLLSAGVSPFDLTILRFGIPLLLSAGYLLYLKWRAGVTPLRRLSPFHPDLLLSAGAIFTTALCTYLSLQTISATTYATLITAGTILTFAPPLFRRAVGLRSHFLNLCTLTLCATGAVLIIKESAPLLSTGPLTGIGAGMGFALYSLASTRYQLQESIRSRYPSFVFYLSLLAFLYSLFLTPLSRLGVFTSPLLLPTILFVMIFTALPYALYFQLLKHEGVYTTGRYIPLFLPIVVVGEALFYRSWQWTVLLPVALSFFWILLYKEHQK